MRLIIWLLAAIPTSMIIPAVASAQTQSQLDRLDELAEFTVATPFCKRLGFRVATDFEAKIDPAIQAQIATWGGDPSKLNEEAGRAVGRQSKILGVDLDPYVDGAVSDEALRNVKQVLLRYGAICQLASRDPIFSTFIAIPEGYDLDRAATDASDEWLSAGGLASWQTPLIANRGDMMMLAGACRRHIGPAESDALQSAYGHSDDERQRAYYRRAFDDGLADSDLGSMTSQQCSTAIANYRRKIARLGYAAPSTGRPKRP